MIKVTIEGECRSGKTTLARAFKEFLKEKGLEYVYVVDDMQDLASPELQERRLKKIKYEAIRIETKQKRP